MRRTRRQRSGGAPARSGAVQAPGEHRPSERSFREWLRVEMRSRRMSQRQLASRSGVNHTTISRLLGEAQGPRLGTALKLAQTLLELNGARDARQDARLLSGLGAASPATHVERALRADESLDDAKIRWVMDYYLLVRSSASSRAGRPPRQGWHR